MSSYQEKTHLSNRHGAFSPEASVWDKVTNGRLADLPLQRLSRTHRGWRMARDGFWFPPPGDVCAGCLTDTPDTWTASAGGAALVPAPRYHGNLPCNGTLVHLVNRFVWRKRWGKYRGRELKIWIHMQPEPQRKAEWCLWCCYCTSNLSNHALLL